MLKAGEKIPFSNSKEDRLLAEEAARRAREPLPKFVYVEDDDDNDDLEGISFSFDTGIEKLERELKEEGY